MRADAHVRLAELNADGGFSREAVEHLQKAAALHAQADDAVKLTAVLKRLVALEPERVGHRVKLAELHAREGRVPDAVEQFHRAAEVLEQAGPRRRAPARPRAPAPARRLGPAGAAHGGAP